jgi:2-haloacid dehalogenase/putative hydrolase of the HAD superfamily
MRGWDVITFDCYGTLIDWEGGIAAAFRAALAADGADRDLARVLAVYHEVEPVVQVERFQNYRAVLTETARRVAARLDWALPDARASFLADSLPGWTPFADTNAALGRLAGAGYRLGILSNVDDELLTASRRHFTVAFDPDLVITAEQVRAYKPAPPHFETARIRLAGRRWLHAAQSYFHDVVPARRLGVPVAWINRKAETPPEPSGAEAEFRTLGEFAAWMTD